ncbi:hypothetical protein HanRHA438_Chr12g0568881 [Helianthus annuus]|nr:hypothetical protein HanRHA438_Chr12g0568881 [Helianthus annuus]
MLGWVQTQCYIGEKKKKVISYAYRLLPPLLSGFRVEPNVGLNVGQVIGFITTILKVGSMDLDLRKSNLF